MPEEDIQALDETVVVAYGSTTKREATGSISVVKAKELEGYKTAEELKQEIQNI